MIRVNGELLDPNLIEDTFSRIKGEAEARLHISCCERDPEFMTEAEDEVVDSILVVQEAERRYPEMPEEQIRARLQKTIEQHQKNGASWEILEQQKDQLREECAANLRMETFMNEVLETVPELTDADYQAYYHEHRDEYRSQAEAHCLHLMKRLESDDGALPPYQLLDHMISLRNDILAGGSFEDIAKRETDKEDQDIDLGWVPLDRPTNPFESVLFSMKEGELSPVLTYEHAFHLVKVTGVKAPTVPPYEEIADEIQSRAQTHRRRTALKSLAAELRKNAQIETVNFSGEE